jgi:hypothetical protein
LPETGSPAILTTRPVANRGSPVEIGKPQRRYTIEPIRDPVPHPQPREEPKKPQPPAPGRPGYEPTRQRA